MARVGRVLELLIWESGMLRTDIEQRLGVSRGAIGRFLSGKVELKFRHVFEILDVLGVPDDIFYQGLLAAGATESPAAAKLRRKTQTTPLPTRTPVETGLTREEVREEIFEMMKLYFERAAQVGSQELTPPPEKTSAGGRRTSRSSRKKTPS